jgi:glutamate carboxypeptidase
MLEDFLTTLSDLVKLESPTSDLAANEKIVALAENILQSKLGSAPVVKQVTQRPNLIWGPAKPKILILTHLDTVWPVGSFTPLWHEIDGAIFGPGIFDMKAGFLLAVHAINALQNEGIDLSQVTLLATTDEETGSFASRELISELSAVAKYVLVMESGLGTGVKIARKGTAMYQVQIHGKAAHAGLEPEKGANAVIEAANLILKISQLNNFATGDTVTPTMVSGGTSSNSVPDFAQIEVDVRSFSPTALIEIDKKMKMLTVQNSEITLEIKGGINRPPFPAEKSQFLFEKLKAVGEKLGQEIAGFAVGGASDGNFAAEHADQVLDGLGAVGGGAHARDEHIITAEIAPRLTLLTEFLKELINE